MKDIPPFTETGVLPAGDYPMTLAKLKQSYLVHGPHNSASALWDASWRKSLVNNLEVMVEQLWKVGIEKIFIDGSFVEDKDHPNDIDGYFECEMDLLLSGRLEEELNLLDPHKVWTWDPDSRRSYRGYPKKQLPMWHRYRVELYPHVGQLSGIQDRYGNELEFPSAFRLSRRDGEPRGIIQITGG
jgi:hypothetical protein